MSEYIPYPAYYDDAPVDLSFVYRSEKPAGKHGFLRAAGDRFEFEDGTPGRFWGTNFNGGANFPEFDYSEKTARRLAKFGVNIVRFHQLDAEWDTPNIFAFTKGSRVDKTTEFDTESIKRLDYLIYCLKKEGIYCYMDMFTYRKFKSGDLVGNTIELDDAAKPYSGYNRQLIDLQKKLAYDLWNHVNPYTELTYRDDPVFVMAEIVNESDLFSRPIRVEPYTSEFRALFGEWLAENKLEHDYKNCDLNDGADQVLTGFKIYLQEKYYLEMMKFMREIGVKIPITGTNWSINDACMKTQLVTDYTDNHYYFYDWRWNDHICMNKAITEVPDCGLGHVAWMRVADKPFFVSEWDMPWPNEYRAESPIYNAAVGALQNWAGFTIHTYAYSNRLDRMNILGKETSAPTIGGVGYREGIFSTWNDPAKFGLFYHAALITRRADVSPAGPTVSINMEGGSAKPAFIAATELSCIAANYEGKGDVSENSAIVDLTKAEVRSANGQLYRSWTKNYGSVDTAMTKCAYGFLAKNGDITLDGLKVNCETDFAVIALSSLTNEPISSSKNILLTTVGRAKNTDAVFDGEKMLDYGRPPILIEVIKAGIELKTSVCNLRIWAVNAEGFYIGMIHAAYENGILKFKLGEVHRSMYYLIQAE